MDTRDRSALGSTAGGTETEHACTCMPADSSAGGVGTAETSACACEGVERVVRRSNRRSIRDALVVSAFVALLVAVVLALWR